MNELDIAKAIAGLEGLDPVELIGCCFVPHGFRRSRKYNPITDLALNCMLRDKYEVVIDYDNYGVYISDANACEFSSGVVAAESFKMEEINVAVCICILKSQGRYLDE
jgi:hypothetical protein